MNRNPLLTVLLCALCACSGPSQNQDKMPPEIVPIDDYCSPRNCQVFTCGGVLPFAYAFADNVELGSFNIEIHNNFDHHTHSTEADECRPDPVKDPVNPWIYNQDYPIPANLDYYESEIDIPIPEDVDPGEYHFMIRVTDASGWQEIRSVSIRISE